MPPSLHTTKADKREFIQILSNWWAEILCKSFLICSHHIDPENRIN